MDMFRLYFIAVIFILFMLTYVSYSSSKFNMLSNRSVVKSDVVMKVIHHNVKSVCPHCGSKGVPMCPRCQIGMYWNGYHGTFVCPSCGHQGFPKCPNCSTFMTWIEAK